jgi:hypothetical protein
LNELLTASSDFASLWNESKETGPASFGPILLRLNVPGSGILRFESVRLTVATNADWLVVFQIPADPKTVNAVQRMKSSGASSSPMG